MKNKKSMAIAMAAVSTLSAVAPVFANEAAQITPVGVNVAKAEGNKVEVITGYDKVYDTKFTTDKKDDTVKEGLTVLDVLSTTAGSEKYLVSKAYTKAELEANNGELAKEISTEKAKLENIISDIKHKLTLSFVDANGKKKALYTIDEKNSGPVQGEKTNPDLGSVTANYYRVMLTNNQDSTKNEEILFYNVQVQEEVTPEVVEPETAVVNLVNAKGKQDQSEYNKLSQFAFELSIAEGITVKTTELNSTTLEIKVLKDDEKKTHLGTITVNRFDKFKEERFTKVDANGDYVGHWAQDSIVKAMIEGKVDLASNFNTQQNITRAQFAKIVCTMFDIEYDETTDSEPFHDVSKADGWKYEYIAALYTQGGIDENGNDMIKVIQGEDDNFRPDDEISRQEVAVILARMVAKTDRDADNVINVNGTEVHQTIKTKFDDTNEIGAWADHAVKYLSNNKNAIYEGRGTEDKKYIVQGSDNKFNPTQSITRAEALVMIERAATANELNKTN